MSSVKAVRGISSALAARMCVVDLGRASWIVTVLACIVIVSILLIEGYYGYAEVTFAVAVAAAINLF